MAKVTNRFYIKAVHDGSSIYAEMMSTEMQLTQRLRPDGSCLPNWNSGETGAVNPILYPRAKVGSSYKAPLIDISKSEGFYYNGSLISWTTVSGKKVSSNCTVVVAGTTYYLFELIESYSHDGITGPAIKIIHNLGGDGNPDNDIIRFDGHVEESGNPIVFSVGQVIRITTQSASGFSHVYGGRSYVNEDEMRTSRQTPSGYSSTRATQPTPPAPVPTRRDGIVRAAQRLPTPAKKVRRQRPSR